MKNNFLDFTKGIGWRIFVPFSLLFVVLTFSLGFLGLSFAKKTATDNAANELRVMSVVLSEQVESYLKRIQNSLRSLSANGGVLDTEISSDKIRTKRIDKFLFDKLSKNPFFDTLAIYDRDGNALGSTDPKWKQINVLKDGFFTKGLSRFSFDDIFEDSEYEDKVLLASLPLPETGRAKAVLVAKVKIAYLYDLMSHELALKGESEAFLLDSMLQFITPAKDAPDELSESHLALTPLRDHLKSDFWVGQYKNRAGRSVLGTVTRLATPKWYLVTERSLEEVFSQVDKIRTQIFIAAICLLIGLLFTTIILSVSITRPLNALVESSQRIASGDLNAPIDIESSVFEIQVLTNEFNKMRTQIAAYQERLIERLEDSERKRIESERLASIGTLASSLAHEIRNPLNSMNLILTQLERVPGAKPKQIEIMRQEIFRLDRLVSSILDYSKPLALQLKPVELKTFLTQIIEFYQDVFKKQGISIETSWPEPLILILIDSDRLKQALINVIQNAIEAIIPGQGILKFSARKQGEFALIEISDNGIGFDVKNQSRIFDLFFTTKEKGTGLGLSTVRKIIDAHGGKVELQRIDAGGTRVSILIPISRV